MTENKFSPKNIYLIGGISALVQHILPLFAPSTVEPIQLSIGLFGFAWFSMLARDLFKLAQGNSLT